MVVDFPLNEQLNETIDLTTDEEVGAKLSRLHPFLITYFTGKAVQAELQERSVPDGQIQAVQVQEEMEQADPDESVLELQVSAVSFIMDI